MPVSRQVARFNKRYTNRLFKLFAARAPGFAIVIHTGRTSGRTYETPINAFRIPSGYRIALTYGPDADWVCNVLAAGGCGLIRNGHRIETTNARLVDATTGAAAIPAAIRPVIRLIGVRTLLLLDRASGRPTDDERSRADD